MLLVRGLVYVAQTDLDLIVPLGYIFQSPPEVVFGGVCYSFSWHPRIQAILVLQLVYSFLPRGWEMIH